MLKYKEDKRNKTKCWNFFVVTEIQKRHSSCTEALRSTPSSGVSCLHVAPCRSWDVFQKTDPHSLFFPKTGRLPFPALEGSPWSVQWLWQEMWWLLPLMVQNHSDQVLSVLKWEVPSAATQFSYLCAFRFQPSRPTASRDLKLCLNWGWESWLPERTAAEGSSERRTMSPASQLSGELGAPPASHFRMLAHLAGLLTPTDPNISLMLKHHTTCRCYCKVKSPWCCWLWSLLLGKSLLSDKKVSPLSHTVDPEREVADRRMSTSTPAGVCRYPRTLACSENGPFFSSSTGWSVCMLWRTRRSPEKNSQSWILCFWWSQH